MKILLVSGDRTGSDGCAMNLGDAFLTDVLADALRARGAEVQVADFGERRISRPGGRINLSGLLALLNAVRRNQAVVIGGGTLIQDDAPSVRSGLPRLCFALSVLAWLTRRPLVYFAVGCDPITRRVPRALFAVALFRRTVWVRDVASAQRCRALSRVEVRVAADACLLYLERNQPPARPAGAAGTVVSLNAREAPQLDAAELDELDGSAIVLAMVQDPTLSDARALAPQVRLRVRVTSRLHWTEAMTIVANAGSVVASRMHAMYLAAITGTPCLAVGTAPKIVAFVTEFGIASQPELSLARGFPRAADSAAVSAAAGRVSSALDEACAGLEHRLGVTGKQRCRRLLGWSRET